MNKKRTNRHIYCIFLILILAAITTTGCIDDFDPGITDYEDLLVIEGNIIKGNEKQYVRISKTAPINFPEYDPIENCVVKVVDDQGNTFHYKENSNGTYVGEIPVQALSFNRKYQLQVVLPGNKEYHSGFIEINESSDVDSLYALVEQDANTPEQYSEGLQFYVNLKAPEGATKNYMWEMEEAWELHTVYDIDGTWHKEDTIPPVYNPRSDKKVCYASSTIKEYFTSSTENLVVNEKKKIPLIYISASDVKLNVKYSLLVKQYALDDESFTYYSQNKLTNNDVGELYQTQPRQSRSNILNINNTEELVLGVFWGSSVTKKRIFFDGPLTSFNITHCNDIVECHPQIGQTLLQYFQTKRRDLSLMALEFYPGNRDSVLLWGYPSDQTCIDCTAEGASTVKPDFWQ